MEPLEFELMDIVFTQVLIGDPPVVYMPATEPVQPGRSIVLFELSTIGNEHEEMCARTGRKVFGTVVKVSEPGIEGIAITIGELTPGERG